MDNPFRFAVVGRGWRAQFFFKLAAMLPERFTVTSVMTRNPGDDIGWDLPVVTDVESMLRTEPEFVITSVSWDANPGLVEAVAALGVPVLSETPPAPDRDGLAKLWQAVGAGGLVQVAEQYLMLPDHAARLAVLPAIGERTS